MKFTNRQAIRPNRFRLTYDDGTESIVELTRVAPGGLGIPLPSMPGPKTFCGFGAGNLGFLSSADIDLGVLLGSPKGSQSSSRVAACTCAFLPSCSSSVALPFAWIKGSGAFPRGFPTRLSHEAFPQGCPTCHRGVSRSSA